MLVTAEIGHFRTHALQKLELGPFRLLSRRPSGSRSAGGSGPGSVPSGRCILRRYAVHYGLGVMAPNRPSCSPFGPAVKKTVSGPKLALPVVLLPTRRLHSPSITIACPWGSRILSTNSPVVRL